MSHQTQQCTHRHLLFLVSNNLDRKIMKKVTLYENNFIGNVILSFTALK